MDAIQCLAGCGGVYPYTNRNGEPIHLWTVGGRRAGELALLLLERSHCNKKRGLLAVRVAECSERRRVREWMRANPERVLSITKGG